MGSSGKRPHRHHLEVEEKDYGALEELCRHLIESFDYMVDGLDGMVRNIKPLVVVDPTSKAKLTPLCLENPKVFQPYDTYFERRNPYPSRCRQAKLSYSGRFMMDVVCRYDDAAPTPTRERLDFGQFPIMLKSKLCHLRNASSKKLVSLKEEPSEMGGYFILSGQERVPRLQILPNRNYPASMVGDRFRDDKAGYTDKAVAIRCVGADQSSEMITLYYLSSGSARLGFWMQKKEHKVPVGIILKALVDTTDHEIFDRLTGSCCEDSQGVKGSVEDRAQIIISEIQKKYLHNQKLCLEHIGKYFKPVMNGQDNESLSNAGEAVLEEHIFVHLENNQDKFNLLIFMLQKLFSLVDQTSMSENPNSLQNQEVLLPGDLITIYLKEKLQGFLLRMKRRIQDGIKDKEFDLIDVEKIKKIIRNTNPQRITLAIENMLSTGMWHRPPRGLWLQQKAGLTVSLERTNFLKFLSQLRAVHESADHKLLPESWGFLCPVHTPVGESVGSLNHMTSSCRITSFYDTKGNIKHFFKTRTTIVNELVAMGMKPSLPNGVQTGPPKVLTVMLDGRVVGSIRADMIEKAVSYLRGLKVSAASLIPENLEVGYVPLSKCGAYPGLYLFTSPSRFVRPVKNVSVPPGESNIELIGPFEQVYMEICCPDGGDGGRKKNMPPVTHVEIHPTGILSVVASLTPYSDHNQSPHNMRQCQMAKQTMGLPSQALHYRADPMLYNLQTPQTPIVRTRAYEEYNIDDFPLGTNAIVAVLAYTGYDMKNTLVLNKSAVARGMFHGHIYHTETVDLPFSHTDAIDSDGLPYVGQKLNCRIYDESNKSFLIKKLKDSEPAVVDYVSGSSVIGKWNQPIKQKANIRFRHPRNPVVGDKFSSRHGQKGVCSQLLSDIDMPFSGSTGMRPDLIINPHAFPSKMTIGMLLESIAAKRGALDGEFIDATPFSNLLKKENEGQKSKTEFGPLLASHGFNYYGNEVLYSGIYGTELKCEIFMGPVYYQRLLPMVLNQLKVRSTGAVDTVTRQPIEGKTSSYAVRFGELERDSVLAHGAAYVLRDRLHTSSDHHVAYICTLCGSILTPSFIQAHQLKIVGRRPLKKPAKATCVACKTSRGMEIVDMPYVFRYLVAEFGAMNIKVNLRLKDKLKKGVGD